MSHPTPADPILTALSRIPLFQAFPPDELPGIAAECREFSAERGEFLFHRGDASHGFYLVLAGQIQLVVSSAGGNEKIIDIISQGGTFGEAVLFLKQPYPVSAKALVDTRCLEIRQTTVDRLLAENETFARRMLAGLSMRLRSLVQDVESYSLKNGIQRVVTYLLQLCPDVESGPAHVQLPTSKFIIASRLNLTPESLSRVFHDLTTDRLIVLQGKKIDIPDVQKLKRVMG